MESLLFVDINTGEPRIQIFNESQIFYRLCMQRLTKPLNRKFKKMRVLLNPRILITTKVNESKVFSLFEKFEVN